MSSSLASSDDAPLRVLRRRALLLYLAVLAVTALAMGWSLAERRQQLIAAETRHAAAAAEMVREWAEASFYQSRMVLSGTGQLALEALTSGSPAALEALPEKLARRVGFTQVVSRLVLLSPRGEPLAASRKQGLAELLAQAGPSLAAMRSTPRRLHHVSGVLGDRPPRAVHLRRLLDRTGQERGVMLAELDLRYLDAGLARETFPLGDSLALRDETLTLVGRFPRVPGANVGLPVDAEQLREALAREESLDGLTFASPLDGTPRLFSARRLEGAPYLVVAGRDLRQVLAPWWQQLAMLAAGWGFLALVGFVALRRHLSLLATKRRLREEASRRAAAQRRLEESAAELKIAAMAFDTHLGMFITDARGRVLRANRTFSRITGFTAAEVIGQNPRMWASGRHDAAFYREMWQTIAAEGSWQGEVWNRRKSGEVYPQWLTISAIHDDHGGVLHYVATLTDLSATKAAECTIQRLAFYDPLTGLPNRRLLIDRLGEVIKYTRRRDHYAALLLVGLDNFKAYNSTLGHARGDTLLRHLAEGLRGRLRESDTLARWGGDQFALLVQDLGDEPAQAARGAERLGDKLLHEVARLAGGEDVTLPLSASIGIALFHDDELDAAEAIQQAELAMYEAKREGGAALRFFDRAMQTQVIERAHLEADLERALDADQLRLFYQPQGDAAGVTVGLEALLRWEHPVRGMVSPGVFIPLAEEGGRIVAIGNWVLEQACHQLAHWADQPARCELTISVNVSPVQFREAGFVDGVREILAATGADPRRLVLEVTESLFLQDPKLARETMLALSALGVRFALDDFGTGYSSLSYLKRLPLDELKIDQSFVRDLLASPADAAIVETIIALADRLSLSVTAEGVETEAQAAWLRDHGCRHFQGYLFARPAPLVSGKEPLPGLPS